MKLALSALILMLVGCQTAARQVPAKLAVTHVVICWMKNPDDEAAKAQIIAASNSFKAIPGVIDVRVGRMLPSTRPMVDSTYDLAVVMDFASVRALREYDSHPLHKQAVQNALLPNAKKLQIYDFALEKSSK